MDIIGNKFGRWTVLAFSHYKSNSRGIYLCRCDCGTEKLVGRPTLISGTSKSCGCLHKEAVTKHNQRNPKLYSIWHNMKDRCYREKHPMYNYYGGRGITVCDKWKDNYTEFHKWSFANGYVEGLSIDRINNNIGYSPDNCKWSSSIEQGRNRRNVKTITYKGETKTLSEWGEIMPANGNTIWQRLNYGWPIDQALTTPSDRTNRHKK